ncbi:MAG: hypothetical protein KGO48_06635 [Alphaproteobacteria bacterium]|nr:hypothetical protein [Alphaproteobacteria bacterium]
MAITYNERDTLRIETGGSIAEAVGGIAVSVLAIISLAETTPSLVLIPIAVIVLGIALLAEGSTIAAEFSRFMGATVDASPAGNMQTGGITLEFLAGIGLVVLGILSLIGIATETLVAVSVIAAGAAMVLRSGMLLEMSDLHFQMSGLSDGQRRLARSSASGVVSVQVLCGIAAVVLGILALTTVHFSPLLFGEIGLLVLAGAITFGSGLWTGSMLRMLMR